MLVVPGRPSANSLTWWVLSDNGVQPTLKLIGPNAAAAPVTAQALAKPGDGSSARDVFVVAVSGLASDSAFELQASASAAPSASGFSRTLPARVSLNQPFTIALGSCYCVATDPGLESCFPPKRFHRTSVDPIRLRFLCGDQIYMDLSPKSGSPIVVGAPDPWARYPSQWREPKLRSFLSEYPSLVMADDHEFWNDYPHGNAWLTWADSSPNTPLARTLDRAYEVFQVGLNLDASVIAGATNALTTALGGAARTFEIPIPPIRFFVLDTRTRRTRFDDPQPHFTSPPWLGEAVQWLKSLSGPGVLVLSQPLVEEHVGWFGHAFHTMGDVNLPDYDDDYAALCDAVFSATHDVLILSGDIHWSRSYQVSRSGNTDREVYELISSALSRIPIGTPRIGERKGKITWASGYARWNQRDDYATIATPTFATVTLTPLATGDDSPIRVDATAWTRGPNGDAVPACPSDTFTLR